MHESVRLFRQICNMEWFRDTSIILFLNKRDLFEEKIKKVDLNVAYPKYYGGKNVQKGKDFVRKKYIRQNRRAG